ncbi:unnamed protein product [Angiostrongylus costaricensis]|uniref:CX domain-containing protein n=1 Tax=Angiostrongylus costaricensis TaxID=334426 RepID=A0A0R3PYW9_ANGCS|nr:unnamed protein product [Angiostrongylus costaricensis]
MYIALSPIILTFQLFSACWGGSQSLDCCSIFEPTYVMLRGRCFRLLDNYNQTDFDEIDKLSVLFNTVQSTPISRKTQPQVVMYIGDSHPEIGLYPRFYLNYHNWNRIRFTQRRISMLSDNPMCSVKPLDQGKSTCFVYNWIKHVLLSPLNCTLPYFKGMLSYVDDVPVCETSAVINDYHRIMSQKLDSYDCLAACERIENHMQMFTSPDYNRHINYSLRFESSFTELQYEHYSEIRLTTAAGFISELGGQSGLFVGCSVMSVIQFILSILSIFTIGYLTITVAYSLEEQDLKTISPP